MVDKRFIGKNCDIIDLDAIFSTWERFFEENNLPKDRRWKNGYRPDDFNNWKIIGVGENKKYKNCYPAGIFLLEKDNHVIIYDVEGVKVHNNCTLKYQICSDDYTLVTDEKLLKKYNFPLKNFSENFEILNRKDYKNWSLVQKEYMYGDRYYILQKYLYGKNRRIIINSKYVDFDFFYFGKTNNIWEVNLWNSI
jgi:hypothetical protein